MLVVAVEVAGRGKDAAIREPFGDLQAGTPVRRRHPQVQACSRFLHDEPCRDDRGGERPAPGAVDLALRGDVLVVGQRGSHRGLHRSRHDEAEMLAGLREVGNQRGVAREERRPVARDAGLLGQGVRREQTVVGTVTHARVEDRRDTLVDPGVLPRQASA